MTENEQLEMIGIINRIKAEAYKEFAERLKEKAEKHDCRYYMSGYSVTAVDVKDIDNLLKEMVGEEK